MRLSVAFSCLAFMPFAVAATPSEDPTKRPYKVIYLAPMTNAPIIGSQDERVGLYVGYQWTKPEKRLTLNKRGMNLVIDVHASHTYGGGWRARPRDKTWNLGALALMRYERQGDSGRGFYYEAGFGIHWASESTWDLDSRFNTTPAVGGGVLFRWQDATWQAGLRLYHISNAGTRGSNQGQNQLQAILGVRF